MSELRFKVATVWRGEWDPEVAYNVLDEVSFSAKSEGVKHGHYRSQLAANREPLSNGNAWVLVLDLEKTQSTTEEAEAMNEAFADAESKRVEVESERVTAESSRVAAENKRVTAENSRVEAEGKRLSAESGRAEAETNRRISEETRISNEQARVSAESGRVAAEAGRAKAFAVAQQERAEAFAEAEAGRDAMIAGKVEDITRLQGVVAKKANIDGYYSSMAVGAAESLIGQNVTTQQFTYQPTGNMLDVQDGLTVVKNIKGNTVVVNQLVNENGTLSLIANRKYFCEINGVKSIITATSGQVLEVNAGDVVIDLTKFFNTGNETTVLEEFERLYPNLPTDYNEGSLLNLNADSIKSVGLNAFNGEYAKVLGGVQYYLGGNILALTFKENLEDEGEAIEIPSDNLYTSSTNGYIVATGNSICINLSHSGYRNGEYEPYKESIVNLPIKKYFPDGMKSAGEVRDEIIWDESIGKYKTIQRVGSLLLSDLSFTSRVENNYLWGFFARIPESYNVKIKSYIGFKENGVTPLCPINTADNVINRNNDGFCLYSNFFIYKNSKYNYKTDLDSFKQSLQGHILYYELETPIETIIDDYDLIDYEVSDFGTEEIISNEPSTPIVAEVVYGVNAVDTLRRLPQTYISTDSMRDFLAQLGSAMNGNWTMEYDEVNGKWVFNFV
jgi:hypothetical protein